MTTKPLKLAEGFPAADPERWRDLAEKALAGKSLDTLTQRTYDGISVAPLYTAQNAPAGRLVARGEPGLWDIRQIVARPDPSAANGEALGDLEGGAASIELRCDQGDGRGVGLASLEDMARALDGVMIDLAPAALDAGSDPDPARLLGEYARKRGAKDSALAFNLDPFAALARDGAAGDVAAAVAFAKDMAGEFPNASFVRVDARPVHEAGGSEAQELAWMLAAGAAYLRAGEQAGMPPDAVSSATLFTLAVGPDVTLEIPKLRAARTLWAHALSACGAAAAMKLQAVTGGRMMTRYDAWTNMLRTTAAGFAGGVGGADIVSVAPMTHALGQSSPFARRIARNTQLLLLEESHLARVADPAAGSFAFEALTEEMAKAGWALFQEIEKRGGLEAAFAWFSGEIARVREARMKNARRRKDAITGVSEFPLIDETEVAAEPWPRPTPVRTGLPEIRLAEPFERLRDAAAKTKPAIFLATLGALPHFNARAMFAKNLFEAGGVRALGAESEHADDAALAAAFQASGAKIACLCGSDKGYGERGEAAARALKQAGCVFVFMAGRPGEAEAALRAAGVEGYAFAGCDAVDVLEQAHKALGISASGIS